MWVLVYVLLGFGLWVWGCGTAGYKVHRHEICKYYFPFLESSFFFLFFLRRWSFNTHICIVEHLRGSNIILCWRLWCTIIVTIHTIKFIHYHLKSRSSHLLSSIIIVYHHHHHQFSNRFWYIFPPHPPLPFFSFFLLSFLFYFLFFSCLEPNTLSFHIF